ncbi:MULTISPECIES: MAB_1171c family putative transporter [unclassified Streptomyces]|uniref:MAB_1171c family putative transporter n=1 Tax=unclassified Streptomyces TaxID=2593676 RepID=UPI0034382BB2
MADLTSYLAAGVFLAYAAHRLAVIRRKGIDPAQRHVVGFALCMGMAMLFNAPATLSALVRLLPASEAVMVLTHQLKTAAFSFLVLVALALKTPGSARPAVRRQVSLALAVQTVSVTLFVAAGPAVVGDFLVVPAGRGPLLAGYNALFAVYGSWCLYVLGRELARHARGTGPGLLRTGLRLMTLAAVSGVVWTSWALHDIAVNLTDGRQGLGEDLVSSVLGAITAVLATGGASATLWGDRLAAPGRWLRAYRTYRALEPLWAALYAELPEIALPASAADRRPGPRRTEFALYRRVIEIRDGHLALRPYVHPRVPRWAAEELGRRTYERDHDAILEAAVIAAALENKRAGRRQDSAPHGHAAHTPPPMPGTVEGEAAWLLRVTGAFRHSATVHAIRSRVRADVPEVSC